MRIVIGSRGSKLAVWQANWVKKQLAAAGHEVVIRIIKTTGDKLQQASSAQPLTMWIAQAVAEAGTKGLFIKEIEEALIAGEVDLAVHSMKDLPTAQPAGLVVAAVPAREDARDVLISRDGRRLGEFAARARVGTSSLRRQAQLRSLRADLEVIPMRGNLDTRLKKLDRSDCEALVLAAAGIHRLGLERRITAYFPIEQMCPAVGQGALALETRQGDTGIRDALRPLDHYPTHLAVRAERAVLRQLGGGCQVPIAAHAVPEGAQLRLWGVVASHTGDRVLRATAAGPMEEPEHLGTVVAEELLRLGAEAILHAVRAAGV
jgi:hydroxymethylbilane synthase